MTDAASTRAEGPKQVALRIEPGRLRSLIIHDYVIRFGFGFLISVLAAVIGQIAGPRVGGLFLAFPAILPATLTLVERKDGIGQALSDIRGATLGAIGMIAFAVVMVLAVRRTPAVGLGGAVAGWVVVSGLAYLLVRGLVKVLGEKQYLPEIPTSDAARLVAALRRKNLTIATAESCTGGMASALLCSVPDAGQFVRGAVIAYTDELMVRLLGVSPEILATYGAISAEVAAAMASGVQSATRADVAIAVTGATGKPADGNPPGLTFVAVACTTQPPIIRRFDGDLGPGRNDERAVRVALQLGECVVSGVDASRFPGEAAPLTR
jgi:nicotinamide-nucleotide amidase